jgi:2-amino-4-hydroxy-6-hydroxymethyldihydropteridine diphosphokinase
MNEPHLAYLSLGSNIQPEVHLVGALALLQDHGKLERISSAWESQSVGADGPNYLNACILLKTALSQRELKQRALLPIEARLGRHRGADKFAPRTIDIDIVVFDNQSCGDNYWEQAFVVVPLSEIYPDYPNPRTQEPILETAARLQGRIWMERRPGVLARFSSPNSSL